MDDYGNSLIFHHCYKYTGSTAGEAYALGQRWNVSTSTYGGVCDYYDDAVV